MECRGTSAPLPRAADFPHDADELETLDRATRIQLGLSHELDPAANPAAHARHRSHLRSRAVPRVGERTHHRDV